MEELKLRGYIKDSSPVIKNRRKAERLLQKFEGSEVVIKIRKKREKRSNLQNNWYNGVAIPAIQSQLYESQGEKYTRDTIHEFHLQHVQGYEPEIIDIVGHNTVVYSGEPKRTSEMNTKEFNEFKEKLQKFWMQYDVLIPDPNQKEFLND